MTPQYKKESSSSEEAKALPSVVTVDIQTLDLNKPLINSETAKKTKPATQLVLKEQTKSMPTERKRDVYKTLINQQELLSKKKAEAQKSLGYKPILKGLYDENEFEKGGQIKAEENYDDCIETPRNFNNNENKVWSSNIGSLNDQ